MSFNGLVRRAAFGLLTRMVKVVPATKSQLQAIPIRTILVVRQDDRIGNLLFITPLFAGLKQTFPQATLDVVISSRFREVLAHNPVVNRIITMDRRRFRTDPFYLMSGIRELRGSRYDLVIDCKRGASLSNTIGVLLARGTHRIGFEHEYSNAMYHHTIPIPPVEARHESERLYSLLAEIWEAPPCPPMQFHFPKDRGPGPPADIIRIHIGGRGKKRIPFNTLVSLIGEIRIRDYNLELLAGPEERDLAQGLTSRIPKLQVTYPSDIVDLARKIAESRVLITPDTGALHIASALNVPTANLFPDSISPVFGPRSQTQAVIDFNQPDAVAKTMEFLKSVFVPRANQHSR